MLAFVRPLILLICLCFHLQMQAQNVGIKTTNPLTALDVNGDFSLRKATLTLPAGGSNNVDLSTNKYSVYDFAGGSLTGGAQLYGFTGGTDGRIVTFYNNSTTGAIQIMDESHPGSASSVAANRIVTGSGNAAVIYQNGSVTLRYDGQKQRWTIVGSNYTDGLSATSSSVWSTSGTNIFNSNAGNVGIGTSSPLQKFNVQASGIGMAQDDGAAGAQIGFYTSLGVAYLQTHNNFDLFFSTNNGAPQMTLQKTTGNVGIGTTVSNPLYKMDIGDRIRLRSGTGSSAGIWMNDPTNTNVIAFMGIADASTTGFYGSGSGWGLTMNTNTGNVGIGTLNPTYKLSVNGNVRAKEVVVETGWADYVFDENYKLKDLNEVEKFIQQNKHLPNIPSAREIETEGLNLGEVQKKMMEKIEELTLYVIELKKEIELLKAKK
jgi:hypothetical protein